MRGAAPVERALLAGDRETGVCVMQLEEGLDTGPVYSRARIPIGPAVTADGLRDHLVRTGAKILVGGHRVGGEDFVNAMVSGLLTTPEAVRDARDEPRS